MIVCPKCGANSPDGTKFCRACGEQLPDFSNPQQQYDPNNMPPSGYQPPKTQADNFFDRLINDVDDHTMEYDPQDIAANKVMSLFSYLGVLILVPVFGTQGSRFARFHINQGLILIIITAILNTASFIFGLIPYVGVVLSVPFYLADLVVVFLIVMGIVNATGGQAKDLPIVGKFRILH